MTPRSTPPRLLLMAVWLALALAWGSSWSVLKVSFRDVGPFTMLGTRMSLAAIACLLWALGDGGLRFPTRGQRRWLLIAMAGQGFLMNTLLFWGGNRLDSSLSGVLFATTPLWAAAASALLRLEPVGGRTLAGVLLGMAGLALVAGPALQGRLDGPGVGAILLAALVCGTTATLIKRHSLGWHIPSILVLQFGLNALSGILLAGLTGERPAHWTAPALSALAYLVLVCSVATYAGIYWLYRHMSAISISMLVLADASMALLLGALWLRETLTWRVLVAAIAVLGGFLLTVGERKIRAAG